MRKLLSLLTLSFVTVYAYSHAPDEYAADLAQNGGFTAVGNWRAVFHLRAGIDVPVNFEIRPGKYGSPEAFFLNAGESFEGGLVRQTADSLFIGINQFDNELSFKIRDGALQG